MPHDREQLRLSAQGPHPRHPPLSHRAGRKDFEPAARRQHLDLCRDGDDLRIGALGSDDVGSNRHCERSEANSSSRCSMTVTGACFASLAMTTEIKAELITPKRLRLQT